MPLLQLAYSPSRIAKDVDLEHRLFARATVRKVAA
jgi:hypothetical protein